jgi:hypothetical protein
MSDELGGPGNTRAKLDLKLTPKGNSTIQNYLDALSEPDNYGSYFSNMRSSSRSVEQAIKDHFGPTLPVQKRSMEKKLGKKFPVKTKQAVDDLIKSLNKSVNILDYSVEDNYILFPSDSNDSQSKTKNIIKTVMGNAGLDYKLEEFENLKEYRRLQKLAGINEIKVNKPKRYDDIQELLNDNIELMKGFLRDYYRFDEGDNLEYEDGVNYIFGFGEDGNGAYTPLSPIQEFGISFDWPGSESLEGEENNPEVFDLKGYKVGYVGYNL